MLTFKGLKLSPVYDADRFYLHKGPLILYNMIFDNYSVSNLFASKPLVLVSAPMVRYSKLEFRSLVRKFQCDLCFTPMIVADSFVKSEKARNNEFTTNGDDKPLIVQFASNNAQDLVDASELVVPYSSGIDINCGCPQKWALKVGFGAQLLSEPETIRSMIRSVRNRVPSTFAVSVKLRLLSDLRTSVSLCQQLEKAGVSFLTVHGRTKYEKSEPVNITALKEICSSLQIPVIANGDVKSLKDAQEMQRKTGCNGVMSARGLLQNPAMFRGDAQTPRECVYEWIAKATSSSMHFITFHHHSVFMLEKVLLKSERRTFNNLSTYPQVINYLNNYYGFEFHDVPETVIKEGIWDEIPTKGKYFLEKTEEPDLLLYDSFLTCQ